MISSFASLYIIRKYIFSKTDETFIILIDKCWVTTPSVYQKICIISIIVSACVEILNFLSMKIDMIMCSI